MEQQQQEDTRIVRFFGARNRWGAGKHVSVIVLLGKQNGFTVRLSPRALVMLFGLFISAAVLAIWAPHTAQQTGGEQTITASLLGKYLTERKLNSPDKEADSVVEAKIKMLVEEHQRVKKYEEELKARASALNTLLREAVKLDAHRFESTNNNAHTEKKELVDPDASGVGGREVSRHSLRRFKPAFRRQNIKVKPVPDDTLARLDYEHDRLTRMPVGLPVFAKKTSGYGWRRSPYGGRTKFHSGVDYAVESGAPVVATGDGVVRSASYEGALGSTVRVDHGDGIETVYAHLSRITVKSGQRICRSQQIGLVGASGRATGPHLHYEVLINGEPHNPERFVQLARFLRFVNI